MADSSKESDSDSPVVKKAKFAGAAKYKSKLVKDWIVKCPFVNRYYNISKIWNNLAFGFILQARILLLFQITRAEAKIDIPPGIF